MPGWTAQDVPDQRGRTAVVTGANSGLGYVTARELARHGARVVLACRSEARGAEAGDRIVAEVPGAEVAFRRLDLGDLASVREFAAGFGRAYERLDLLVNNAGVMALPAGPHRRRVRDPVRRQPPRALRPDRPAVPADRRHPRRPRRHRLQHGPRARQHRPRRPQRRPAALPQVDRLRALQDGQPPLHARAGPTAVAHRVPLSSRPPRTPDTPPPTSRPPGPGWRDAGAPSGSTELGNRVFAQSAEAGALPSLYAATAPGVAPDAFVGPSFAMWRGAPAPSWRASWTRDDRAGELLWAASRDLTGVAFDELKD